MIPKRIAGATRWLGAPNGWEPERDADLKAENSIDSLVAQIANKECRIEFGRYAGGGCWAYVWVLGEREICAEGDGETFAEAIRRAIEAA